MGGERSQALQGLGGIAAVLRAGGRHAAGGQLVDDPGQFLGAQILVVILADLRHRRVGAGAKAFDLFPRKLAIRRKLVRIGGDLVLADGDQVFRAADHAGQRAANLNMRDRAHGLQLEHEVERSHLKRTDRGHAEHIGDSFDRRTGQPALLLLRAPQKRDDRRSLTAFGIFGDLRFGPGLVGGGEGETLGLVVVQAAEH